MILTFRIAHPTLGFGHRILMFGLTCFSVTQQSRRGYDGYVVEA